MKKINNLISSKMKSLSILRKRSKSNLILMNYRETIREARKEIVSMFLICKDQA